MNQQNVTNGTIKQLDDSDIHRRRPNILKDTNSLEGSLSFISYEDSFYNDFSEEMSINSKNYNNALQMQVAKEVQIIIESLKPDNDQVVELMIKLTEMIKEFPEVKESVLDQIADIRFILENAEDLTAQHICLQLINEICTDSVKVKESICLLGLPQVIMNYVGEEWPREIRIEAGYFLGQLYDTDETLKLIMSAGTLEILPKLLDTEYAENKDLITVGLDCIFKVIDLDIKFEECFKIWAGNRTIERLAIILINVLNDPNENGLITKVAYLFLNFSMASREVKLKV